MSLRLHKVIVQVVLAEERDGEVVGETVAEPIQLFGFAKVREFAEHLPDDIAQINAQRNNGVAPVGAADVQ